jgi:FKBP-type peptidyl-prolyl cis-trans isomerase
MAFWMLGEENPEPSKAAQNQRWQKLRADWMAVKAQELSRGEAGFITTRSGLLYAIRTRVSGQSPDVSDALTINYVATLPDGTQFANTYQSGNPRTVQLGPRAEEKTQRTEIVESRPAELIGKGWDEALRLMHAGEKATFIMPRQLAFGESGGKGVPPGESVRFEVELVSVQPNRDRVAQAGSSH